VKTGVQMVCPPTYSGGLEKTGFFAGMMVKGYIRLFYDAINILVKKKEETADKIIRYCL